MTDPAARMIYAPWTDAEVEALNMFQQSGVFHPFTCPHGHGDLAAQPDGFWCGACGYQQTWAHAAMADKAFIERQRYPFGGSFDRGLIR